MYNPLKRLRKLSLSARSAESALRIFSASSGFNALKLILSVGAIVSSPTIVLSFGEGTKTLSA